MANQFSDIDDIILSFLRGGITLKEKEILQTWINKEESNKDYFKKIYMIWNSAGMLEDTEKADRALQKVRDRINRTEPEKEIQLLQEKNTGYSFWKWAAIILVTLTAGFIGGGYYFKGPDAGLPLVNSIAVPMGSKSHIELPDGTTVVLNAGSKLTYKTDYGNTLREVTLVGEGYFKVAKLKNKPFIVHTSKANIKALGTEFNVKAYPEENLVETILVNGLVEVNELTQEETSKITEKKGILLRPGQKIGIYEMSGNEKDASHSDATAKKGTNNTLSNQKTIVDLKESDPEVETSWKESRWIIKGETLPELAKLFSRRYNVNIHIEDKELTQFKFSGIIQNETIEQVFTIMQLTIPVTYSIDKGEVTWAINRKLEKDYNDAYQNKNRNN